MICNADPASLRTLAAPHHRRLSATAASFLHFMDQHPECLERTSFELLDREIDRSIRRLQAWPLFIDRARSRELGRVTVTLAKLIRSLPRRLFAGDPHRLAKFYGIDRAQADLLAAVMEAQDSIDLGIGRGDFIDGPQGFRCLEYNMSSLIGGWASAIWADLYLQVPILRRFVAQEGIAPQVRDPLCELFQVVCQEAQRKLDRGEKAIHVALTTNDPRDPQLQPFLAHFEEQLRAVLTARWNLAGRLVACRYTDLKARAGKLFYEDLRIRVVIEQNALMTPAAFACWMAGSVDIYNGPARRIFGDKRNLALLSEHAGSSLFSAAERRVIDAHVPWTRCLVPGTQTLDGATVELPEVLLRQRWRFVLKAANSSGGRAVKIGAYTSASAWEELVQMALEAGDWVVQERVESSPLLFQHGQRGCELHEVIWGLIAIADRYAGGYLRMQPVASQAIVNASRGATSGVYFEV